MMTRLDLSPEEISSILKEHVSRLSVQEIVLMQFWLSVELLRRFVDCVLGVTLFWLTSLLQRRCRVGRDDLQEAPTTESSGNRVSGETEDQLWHQYFADPSQWWDNRENKQNPKGPNFKHKVTRKALWIEGWYTPSWVRDKFDH